MLKILTTDEFFSSTFEDRWNALLAKCPPHDLGQTYIWNQCWWKYFMRRGASEKRLLLLADETHGQLDAVWPFFVRTRWGVQVIQWIGQAEGMITDYMLPLVPTANHESAARALLEFLAEHRAMWDVLDLSVPPWSGLFSLLPKAAAIHGAKLDLKWSSGIFDHSSAISLPSSFDKFLSSLGSTTRHHVRQYLRGAEKAGARFEIVRGADVANVLPDLFRLNGERWQVFANEASRDFLTEVTHRIAGNNPHLFLACLRLEEQVIAIALCYEHASVCYVHSAGVVRQSPKGFSPGTTLYALLVRSFVEQSGARLDLSPGIEEYKLRLGAVVEPVYRFTLWHSRSAYNLWRTVTASREAKTRVATTVRAYLSERGRRRTPVSH